MLKVYIYAAGCTENLLDAQRYCDFLLQNDFYMTEEVSDADIILFVTCGVTSYIANECSDKYKSLKGEMKEGAKIIACGCLPFIDKEKINGEDSNALYFKSSHGDVTQLAKILGLEDYKYDEDLCGHQFFKGPNNGKNSTLTNGEVATASGRLKELVELETNLSPVLRSFGIEDSKYFKTITEEIYKESYFVHVARGCGGNCSYCAVKFVKGDVKSKSIEQILNEIKTGHDLGFKEIVLAGDDIGSYGKDINIDFYDLMTEITKLNLDVNFTIRNFEPFWLINNTDKMLKLLESNKFRSICIPIQSGSSKVLKDMKRTYTAEQVLNAVSVIKKKFPEILISSHFMVGFPGETDEDFNETIAAIRSSMFDFIRYSMYTDRPNTEASKRTDKIGITEKMLRMNVIGKESDRMSEELQNKIISNWSYVLKEKIDGFIV